jgi:hypothetical protein
LSPDAINSHTGKDYYDWRDNIDIIAKAEQVAISSGIPIWHEIHRGRFSFHLKTLLQYLAIFPQLKLVADLSHFCVVSESDLHDQQDLLTQIYPNIAHIHARVGFLPKSITISHQNGPITWRDISIGGVKLSNITQKQTNHCSPLRQNVARFPICLRRPLPEIPWPINGNSTCK